MTTPQRTHPLTPLVQAAPSLAFGAVFLLGPGRSLLTQRIASGVPIVVLVLAGSVALYAIVAAASWASWSRRTYWIDDDGDLRVDSGLLQRSSRRLQLSRLQSVDVVSPILARLFGLVEVRAEARPGPLHIVLVIEGPQLHREVIAAQDPRHGLRQLRPRGVKGEGDAGGGEAWVEGGGEVADGDVRPAGRAGMEVEAGEEAGEEAGAGSR